jgi:hypothetical protein
VRVLICGSRTFGDYESVSVVLAGFAGRNLDVTVIHGAAPGADSLAARWAKEYGYDVQAFPADWDRYGKRAGYVRNQQMLDEGHPEVVWAFVDKPLRESKGTSMMVELARNAGLPVHVVFHAGEAS